MSSERRTEEWVRGFWGSGVRVGRLRTERPFDFAQGDAARWLRLPGVRSGKAEALPVGADSHPRRSRGPESSPTGRQRTPALLCLTRLQSLLSARQADRSGVRVGCRGWESAPTEGDLVGGRGLLSSILLWQGCAVADGSPRA